MRHWEGNRSGMSLASHDCFLRGCSQRLIAHSQACSVSMKDADFDVSSGVGACRYLETTPNPPSKDEKHQQRDPVKAPIECSPDKRNDDSGYDIDGLHCQVSATRETFQVSLSPRRRRRSPRTAKTRHPANQHHPFSSQNRHHAQHQSIDNFRLCRKCNYSDESRSRNGRNGCKSE